MSAEKKIEVFSAGCGLCSEVVDMVMRVAGSRHQVVVRDMHKVDVARKAKDYGIRTIPAVVIDGKLVNTHARHGPHEREVRAALE
jgi:hypothetical protein